MGKAWDRLGLAGGCLGRLRTRRRKIATTLGDVWATFWLRLDTLRYVPIRFAMVRYGYAPALQQCLSPALVEMLLGRDRAQLRAGMRWGGSGGGIPSGRRTTGAQRERRASRSSVARLIVNGRRHCPIASTTTRNMCKSKRSCTML